MKLYRSHKEKDNARSVDMAEFVSELCRLSNGIKISEIIPDSNGLIYHYTSPSGLKGIIENKTMRFTDRYFLNDFSEGTYIMDLCINKIDILVPNYEKFKKELLKRCSERKVNSQKDDFYVHQCSFSKDEDSLALWNYYTKGNNIQGYNLCFDAQVLYSSLKLESILESGKVPVIWRGDVVYGESEQLVIVKKVVDAFFELSEKEEHQHYQFTIGLLVDKLMLVGIFFKKKCFNIENEYRMVMDLHIDKSTGEFTTINSEQKFYEKNGFLIPYLDVEFGTEALKEIRISPTLDLETTKNSIYRATVKTFPHINKNDFVKQSEIPVRY